jgi:hypothetical protein
MLLIGIRHLARCTPMKRVFIVPTITEAATARNLLTVNGIDARVSEQPAAGQALETEVWVERDDQADRALELIQEMYSANTDEDAWNCGTCSEENPGSFGLCWKCGSLRK